MFLGKVCCDPMKIHKYVVKELLKKATSNVARVFIVVYGVFSSEYNANCTESSVLLCLFSSLM
jgi:hypothetical protein